MASRVLVSALLFATLACSENAEVPRATGGAGGQAGSTQGGTAGMPAAGAGGLAGASGSAGTSGAGAGGSSGSAGSAGTAGGGAGGSAGSAGAGGSAGGGAYEPCPTDGSACRIMPLGDSITDGVGSDIGGGYRPELFHLALTDSRQLTFVGSGQNGPATVDDVNFPRYHEGHSGWTIDDGGGRSGLYPKIAEWFALNPPHIVTLQIGTNDVHIELDLEAAPERLGLLLDRIIENAPEALIVVAQIVPTTDDAINTRVQAFNAAIPALVAERAAAGAHIVSVDMYGAFTSNGNYKSELMDDTLHPKDAGYVVMADTWYEVIGPLLPPEL